MIPEPSPVKIACLVFASTLALAAAAGPRRTASSAVPAPSASTHAPSTPSPSAMVPFTLRDDFQRDGLDQWASYPPVQDVGYEPSLTPTREWGARGGRSLMRVVRPSAAGPLRIGFIKHVPFAMDRRTRLSLAYRIEAPGSAGRLEIALAGASGRLYRAGPADRVPAGPRRASAGAWATADVAASDFTNADGSAPRDGESIEAIVVTATIAHATPDVAYRVLLDDVVLEASRPAAFTVATPSARPLDPWRVLVSDVGYRAGETIAVEVEAPLRMARVACTIAPLHDGAESNPHAQPPRDRPGSSRHAQPLYDDGTHGDRRAGDGRWTSDAVRLVTVADRPGIWTATVDGETVQGSRVKTTIRFLVHAADASPRPRLYFDAGARDAVRARTAHSRMTALWTQIRERAASSRASGELADGGVAFSRLDREYLLPSLLGYFDVLNRGRQRIASNALVAYLDGDAQAAASARAALLDVARWERWAPPWFEAHGQHTYYPAGQLAAAVALAYDLLHDRLTPDERQIVRQALIERSILPTWREYVLDNRVMAHTSNWIAHTVGGALIAAAAIEGDTTPAEQAAIEAAVNGLLVKIESHMAASFLADGSYGEGISYQEFDLETLGPMLHALTRVFGIDYWSRTHVAGSLAYALATLADPVAESFDMGDTHPPAGHGIAPIVAHSTDPVVRWYASRFTPRTIEDFLFFDERVPPAAPASPGSRLFPDKGHAVFRTGWGKDDGLVLFRAGPTFNHHHADQGAFLFRALGETFATEAGWSDYYKDPYYATFFTQTIGHNTVLVDGDPESQAIADTRQFAALDAYPRITDALLSDTYDFVTSELSAVYKGRLSGYTRRLVYVKPHYLLVHDDLRTSGDAMRFEWLLHVPDEARVEADGLRAMYTGERASLAVRSLLPGAAFDVRRGHLPYGTFAQRTPHPVPAQPAYLDLRTAGARTRQQFVVALVPARTASAAREAADRITPIDESEWTGAVVTRGARSDVVLFRARADAAAPRDAAGAARFREWLVDASAWSTTHEGGALVQMTGERLTRIEREGRLVASADRPLSLVVRYAREGATVAYATRELTGEATRLTLALTAAATRVEIDGTPVPVRAGGAPGTIALDLPPGRHDVRIHHAAVAGDAAARAGRAVSRIALDRPSGHHDLRTYRAPVGDAAARAGRGDERDLRRGAAVARVRQTGGPR